MDNLIPKWQTPPQGLYRLYIRLLHNSYLYRAGVYAWRLFHVSKAIQCACITMLVVDNASPPRRCNICQPHRGGSVFLSFPIVALELVPSFQQLSGCFIPHLFCNGQAYPYIPSMKQTVGPPLSCNDGRHKLSHLENLLPEPRKNESVIQPPIRDIPNKHLVRK